MKRIFIWCVCLLAVCASLLTACGPGGAREGAANGASSTDASGGAAVRDAAREQASALESKYGVTGLSGWEPGPYQNSMRKSGSTATMNVVAAVDYHSDLAAYAQTFYDIYLENGMGREMSGITPAEVADVPGYTFSLIDLSRKPEQFTVLYVYNKNEKTYLATGQAETEADFAQAGFLTAIAAYSY